MGLQEFGAPASRRTAAALPRLSHYAGLGLRLPAPVLRVLGPMQVLGRGGPLPLGSRKQQLVLAALLSSPNSPVSVDSLTAMLWDEQPPRTARKNIQVHVCAIRTLLLATESTARISHSLGGYMLHLDAAELDSLRFEDLARTGLRLWQGGQIGQSAIVLRQALDLWQGQALAGLRAVPLVAAAAQRLEGRHLSVLEYWAEAEVAAGAAAGVIDQICAVAEEHPLRERLRMVQMAALCQLGRRAEALAVYDGLRQGLAGELGLNPSQAMAAYYQSLLRDDQPAREAAEAQRGQVSRPPRRTPAVRPALTRPGPGRPVRCWHNCCG